MVLFTPLYGSISFQKVTTGIQNMPQLCQEVKFSFGKRFSWIPLFTRPRPRQGLPILEIYKNHTPYIEQVITKKHFLRVKLAHLWILSQIGSFRGLKAQTTGATGKWLQVDVLFISL